MSATTDRLLQDYLDRWRKGERPQVTDFLREHPEAGPELKDLLPALVFMEELAAGRAGPAASAPPERLGDCRIVREIGRGGMGIVYEAVQEPLGRKVAVKVVASHRLADPVTLERFRREAETTARLDHPGICAVHAAAVENGVPYIVMPFVEGDTLARRIVAAPPAGDWQATLALVEGAARALHAAHEAGIVHRDVKPSNIMITAEGRPVIMDFGLARDGTRDLESLTRTGDSPGTPHYMAPEQVSSRKLPIDRRADVYALGVTLYEALTGRRPFEAETREALYQAILTEAPPDLRRVRAGLPRDLSRVLARALDKDLDRRYPTALDFAEDLRRVAGGAAVRIPGVPARRRAWGIVRRHPATVVTAAVIAIAALVARSLVHDARRHADLARAARAEALHRSQESLEAWNRLADLHQIEELNREESNLWPALPERIQGMQEWLARAHALAARLPSHRAYLEEIRKEARPAEGGASRNAWHFDEARAQLEHDQLVELVQALEALAAADGGIAGVQRRMATARESRERLHGTDADAWERAIEAAASAPVYGGLRLGPAAGLVPLGPDPGSGLQEFAVLGTGDVPARGAGDRLELAARTAIVLVLLPGGRFRMGAQSTAPAAPNFDPAATEDSVREETVEPFLIAKLEATRAQWARLHGRAPSTGRQLRLDYSDWAGRPCEMVERNVAAGLLARAGLRLPTEVEWEYACRAGTTTPWSFGAVGAAGAGNAHTLPADSTLQEIATAGPAPAGSLAPNAFGLHDLHGNVREWVGGPESVSRGGSWRLPLSEARSAARKILSADTREEDLGFRAARHLRR